MLSSLGALRLPMALQWVCCIRVRVTPMILGIVTCRITIRVQHGQQGETKPR